MTIPRKKLGAYFAENMRDEIDDLDPMTDNEGIDFLNDPRLPRVLLSLTQPGAACRAHPYWGSTQQSAILAAPSASTRGTRLVGRKWLREIALRAIGRRPPIDGADGEKLPLPEPGDENPDTGRTQWLHVGVHT